MTYGDSVWNGEGYIGRVCADPECSVILHETAEAHATEEAAWLAACSEWSALTTVHSPLTTTTTTDEAA